MVNQKRLQYVQEKIQIHSQKTALTANKNPFRYDYFYGSVIFKADSIEYTISFEYKDENYTILAYDDLELEWLGYCLRNYIDDGEGNFSMWEWNKLLQEILEEAKELELKIIKEKIHL